MKFARSVMAIMLTSAVVVTAQTEIVPTSPVCSADTVCASATNTTCCCTVIAEVIVPTEEAVNVTLAQCVTSSDLCTDDAATDFATDASFEQLVKGITSPNDQSGYTVTLPVIADRECVAIAAPGPSPSPSPSGVANTQASMFVGVAGALAAIAAAARV